MPMACMFFNNDKMVAVGGMDNVITLFDRSNTTCEKKKVLVNHEGYISSLKLLAEQDNVGKDSYTVVISFSRFLLTRSPLFALREPSPSDAGAFLATRPGRHQPLLPRRRIRSLSCSLRGRGLAFETWRTSL